MTTSITAIRLQLTLLASKIGSPLAPKRKKELANRIAHGLIHLEKNGISLGEFCQSLIGGRKPALKLKNDSEAIAKGFSLEKSTPEITRNETEFMNSLWMHIILQQVKVKKVHKKQRVKT